jgi:hypothetical protein
MRLRVKRTACFDRLSITALNDVQAFDSMLRQAQHDSTALTTCFDRLSMTAFNDVQTLKLRTVA